jgi:copper chaperone CopZ
MKNTPVSNSPSKILRSGAVVVALSAVLLLAGCGSGNTPTPQSVATATYVIDVKGMTCEGCANAIVETLEPVPGVTSVSVDHAAGKATVTATANPEMAGTLTKLITDVGYEATVPE